MLTWYDDDDNGTPYGKGSDLWSLGVLLYVILSGCSPFSADEEELLLKQARPATLGAGGCSTRCWRLRPFLNPLAPSRTPPLFIPPPQVAEAKYDFFENEWKNISDDAKDIIRRLAPE